MEDTNTEFILRGLEHGDRRLIISKENLAALAAGAEVVVDGGRFEVIRIVTYLSITSSNCYMTSSSPIMEVKPKE